MIKAISLLKEAIRLDSAFSEAYISLGERYLRLRISSQNSTDDEAIVDSARSAITKAIELNPESARGNLSMAHLNRALGKYSEALNFALKAHEIDPYDGTPTIEEAYTQMGDFRNAAAFLKKEIELDPRNWENYSQLSSLYLHLGMIDSARVNMDKALSLAPPSTPIPIVFQEYYRLTGQVESLTKMWPKVSHVYDSASANYVLGVAFFLKRDWATADSLYRISSAPDDLDAGCIAIHLGRKDEGVNLLKKAINRRLNSRIKGFWELMDAARGYAMLGDKQYLKYGKAAFDNGWHSILWLKIDPFFDAVRDTPEFKELEKLFDVRNEEYKRQVLEVMTLPIRIPEMKR